MHSVTAWSEPSHHGSYLRDLLAVIRRNHSSLIAFYRELPFLDQQLFPGRGRVAGSTQPDHVISSEKRFHTHVQGRATIESRWPADVGKEELTDQSLHDSSAAPLFRQHQQ